MSSSTTSEPLVFPHDGRSAAKTAKAGILTVNDVISQDNYSIMTRATDNDAITHTAAVYSLDEDTGSLIERTRVVEELGTDGSASMNISVMQTTGATSEMQQVYNAAPTKTTITAGNTSASFTMDGLQWDNASSSLYLGGNAFRIQYTAGDAQSNQFPALRIQALTANGTYVTKFAVVND